MIVDILVFKLEQLILARVICGKEKIIENFSQYSRQWIEQKRGVEKKLP